MSRSTSTRSRIFQYWNWKSGLLSAGARGLLFVALTISHGSRAAVAAFSIEALFRIVTSGFYGAVTQAFRNIKPAWLGVLYFAVIMPVLVQSCDSGLHAIFGTPNLLLGSAISCVWMAIASLFDWYAMRQGVLVTGEGSQSLWADAKCIPGVAISAFGELFGSDAASPAAPLPTADCAITATPPDAGV